MASLSRFNVAKLLEPLGLRKTLIVLPERDGYTVNRLKSLGHLPDLICIGRLQSSEFVRIGRIGLPDAALPIPWTNSLSFYGRWFDKRASIQIRARLCSLPHKTMLAQVARDDQYALIGSYYSVFQTIMDIKQRVPLVLINDRYLSVRSFPVVLAHPSDGEVERECFAVLRRLLRMYPAVAPVSDGIVVEDD